MFYVFIYVSLFKLLFVLLIKFFKRIFISIDQIDREYLKDIRSPKINGKTYYMVDYIKWFSNTHIFYSKIYHHIIYNMTNYFFILSVIFYLSSLGVIEVISAISLLCFKVMFTFILKKPFSNSLK